MPDEPVPTAAPPASESSPAEPFETVRDVRKARITVVQKLYHTPQEGDSTEDSHAWTLWLESDEQPWGPRHLAVGPEWTPLPEGWGGDFAEAALLVNVFNREGAFRTRTPTPEEREAALARVVELGVAVRTTPTTETVVPFAAVRPLTCQPLQLPPGGLRGLRARCPAGEARISVTIFPG